MATVKADRLWRAARREGPDMAREIYYTTSTEAKKVYHTHTDCSEGKKIESKDKVTRALCEVCAKKG
jgi:hypothetical protein